MVLGEDVQWSLYDGEVSSSRGHLLLKENRHQQTCYAICILYPSKHKLYPSLSLSHTDTHTDTKHSLLFLMLLSKLFVNLIKWFRWVEGQWEDDVSLSHGTLLLYTGMAGAPYSWWWDKTQSHTPSCRLSATFAEVQKNDIFPVFFFFFLKTQPTSGWRTVRSCCPHPITALALTSHYKPPNGYATLELPMSTSFLR